MIEDALHFSLLGDVSDGADDPKLLYLSAVLRLSQPELTTMCKLFLTLSTYIDVDALHAYIINTCNS